MQTKLISEVDQMAVEAVTEATPQDTPTARSTSPLGHAPKPPVAQAKEGLATAPQVPPLHHKVLTQQREVIKKPKPRPVTKPISMTGEFWKLRMGKVIFLRLWPLKCTSQI